MSAPDGKKRFTAIPPTGRATITIATLAAISIFLLKLFIVLHTPRPTGTRLPEQASVCSRLTASTLNSNVVGGKKLSRLQEN